MTTDLVALPVGISASDALAWIRRERPEQQALHYVYLVDDEEALTGVATLRDLVLAEPAQRVDEIMEDDVVSVSADTDEEEVGRIMTKYDLLAIPVVDDARRLVGIVTLDDALDALLPEEWKQRLPRLFR
jgi:magnesium transporter